MSTLQENLDRIKNAKSAIKDAIIQKGIDVTDTEKIETYADKILQIKSGGGTTEIPEFDPNGPLTIYCFDDWGDAYVRFDAQYTNYVTTYSTDGTTWKSYSNRQVIKLKKGEYVQFKCSFQRNNTDTTRFTMKNGLFNLYGNITSLNDYKTTVIGSYSPYKGLFSSTNVYDCSKLNLGKEITITYEKLFQYCKKLAYAPELPATTLTTSCYYYMFNACESLTKAPELPATTLASSCYESMFEGCTSLIKAPALPATTLMNQCYSHMFDNCTSLIKAPALPATTLANKCYYYMFYYCRSLTNVPALPATTLANQCYQNMFQSCSSLTTLPSNLLPAKTLMEQCYSHMFDNCTSLTTIPNLPATTLTKSCYYYMFQSCSSLVETPDGWYLPAKTTDESSCRGMFYNCSKLQKMAVAYSGTITTSHWQYFLSGVKSTGTFYYSKNQTKENIQSIVPSGWTLVQSTAW